MLRFANVGDKVMVHHRSSGDGRLDSEKKGHEDRVELVYSDGAVKLAGSGETWNIKRGKDGVWVTTTYQRRS